MKIFAKRASLGYGFAVIAVLALSTQAFGLTALSLTDPSLQGTTITTETFAIDELNPGGGPSVPLPVFFVDEKIVQNTSGTLDFYFKVRNVGDPQPLRTFGVSYSDSIEANLFYLDEGNLAPTSGDLSPLGNQTFTDYLFGGDPVVGPLLGTSGTDTLLLRTNANAYTDGTITLIRSIDDFDILPGTGLVPDVGSLVSGSSVVPEPTSLALFLAALVALTIRFRRASRSTV